MSEGPMETKTLRIDDRQDSIGSLKAKKIPLTTRTEITSTGNRSRNLRSTVQNFHTVAAAPGNSILLLQKYTLPSEGTPL